MAAILGDSWLIIQILARFPKSVIDFRSVLFYVDELTVRIWYVLSPPIVRGIAMLHKQCPARHHPRSRIYVVHAPPIASIFAAGSRA